MLSGLREKIRAETLAFRPPPRQIVRTFYLICARSFSAVRDWYSARFPVTKDELAVLQQWVDCTSRDPVALNTAVDTAFAALPTHKLPLERVQLLEGLTHVVVLTDAGTEGISQAVVASRMMQDALRARVPSAEIAFCWTGVFLATPGVGRNNIPRPALAKFAKDFDVDRVFLIDSSNPRGALMTRDEDTNALVGQLLWMLCSTSATMEPPSRFAEWLRQSNAAQGFVSGFGALSLSLPVEQIVEAVAVHKSADVMRHALLSEGSEERASANLHAYAQATSLLTFASVAKTVCEDPELPLEEVHVRLPEFDASQADEYFDKVGEIDAEIGKKLKVNTKLITRIEARRLAAWCERLDEVVDAILAADPGCISTAELFLVKLSKHLAETVPERVQLDHYIEPGEAADGLRSVLVNTPRREAVYARGLVCGFLADVVLWHFDLFLPFRWILLAVPVALGLGWAAIKTYRHESLLEAAVDRVRQALEDKWRVLMDYQRREAARRALRSFVSQVTQTLLDIRALRSRVEELAEYAADRHTPEIPYEAASWLYVLRERSEMFEYASLCKPLIGPVAEQYLRHDRPLFPWRRHAPNRVEGDEEIRMPNEWEWTIIEKAATRVLPACQDIVRQHVLRYLTTHDDRINDYVRAFVRAAQPFLNVNPLRRAATSQVAELEVETEDRFPIVRRLLSEVEKNFPGLVRVEQHSPYRLTLFARLESIHIEDVLFAGGR
jgi:hypothetical protein